VIFQSSSSRVYVLQRHDGGQFLFSGTWSDCHTSGGLAVSYVILMVASRGGTPL
jgi:hypothetical protein